MQVSEEVRHMARSDVGHGITEIHHNDGHERWLVVRRKLTDTQQVWKDNIPPTQRMVVIPSNRMGTGVLVVPPRQKITGLATSI